MIDLYFLQLEMFTDQIYQYFFMVRMSFTIKNTKLCTVKIVDEKFRQQILSKVPIL